MRTTNSGDRVGRGHVHLVRDHATAAGDQFDPGFFQRIGVHVPQHHRRRLFRHCVDGVQAAHAHGGTGDQDDLAFDVLHAHFPRDA